MRKCYGWVVVMPGGWACLHTMRGTRREATRAWVTVYAAGPWPWREWRKDGYRCVKVELRLVEKRKGGGR